MVIFPAEDIKLSANAPLKTQGIRLNRVPGLYVITCGPCVAHVGTSKDLAVRIGQLARLRAHRGSNEVLCAAYCTQSEPVVWWKECHNDIEARKLEQALTERIGNPPFPEKYHNCRDGNELLQRLIEAAGPNSWEAGYIEALFATGESLHLLFQKRFETLWKTVGKPPGPWSII